MKIFIKFIYVSIGLLMPVVALAKGDVIGFSMEGTVTNVVAIGESIQFKFTGRFEIGQTGDRGTKHSYIEVDCKRGVSATVTQHQEFFADMPGDISAGAGLRGKGELLKILKKAAARGAFMRLTVMEPKMAFGRGDSFTLLDGVVSHATDPDGAAEMQQLHPP
jgi:hypothetical protein